MMNEFLEALNDEVMDYFADIGIYPGIKPEKIRGEYKRLYDGWTATTGRHIKAFCGMTKAEFLSL